MFPARDRKSAAPLAQLSLSSGPIRPLDGLAPYDAVITAVKYRHSALAGTDLAIRLQERGNRTEPCCETNTRRASDECFEPRRPEPPCPQPRCAT
jgi:hypothetical protein